MATVVISAYDVVNYPQGGGHFWVYLQYVLGLRLLGHDVYWLEAFRTKGREEQEAAALATFQARMQQYGLGGRCILYRTQSKEPLSEAPAEYLNMTRTEAEAVFGRADLLLNFHYAISPALLSFFRRTALVDIDPGLLQFWITSGQLHVPRHDFYFSTAEGVGRCGDKIPSDHPRWMHIRPACEVAGTPEMYQAYIQRSRGEFSCAKPSYIKLQTSWISDRTICYLASGKPVVVQHTGPSSFLPDGEGMFRFLTLQDAANALEVINSSYRRQSQAARQIAERHFDSKQVVTEVLTHALR